MNTLHCDKFWTWFFAVLWWPFWKWRPVEILQCRESIPDIIIYHCPISSKFDMWVDNDVPNWFPTLKNFYRSPFLKWPPQYRTNPTLSDYNDISYVILDIINYPHMKCHWNRTMLNLCGIVVAILKMATARNFSMLGIYSGHHNLPTYEMSLKSATYHMYVDYDVPNWFLTSKNFYRSPFSKWPPQCRTNSTMSDFNNISYVCRLDNAEFVRYCGGHFENGDR
jgi:hypothetical protein